MADWVILGVDVFSNLYQNPKQNSMLTLLGKSFKISNWKQLISMMYSKRMKLDHHVFSKIAEKQPSTNSSSLYINQCWHLVVHYFHFMTFSLEFSLQDEGWKHGFDIVIWILHGSSIFLDSLPRWGLWL